MIGVLGLESAVGFLWIWNKHTVSYSSDILYSNNDDVTQ